MKLLVLALCISIQILSSYSKVLPNNFPEFCSKNHPEYNQCFKNALEKMGPHFLKGIKGIDFPKLHPLTIPSFLINRNLNNFAKVKGEMKNIQIYGFDTVELTKLEFDPEALKGVFAVHIPNLNYKFEYDAVGTIDELSITNAGFVSGNMSDIDLEFRTEMKKVDRVGVDYLTLTDVEAKGSVQAAHLKMIAKNPAEQSTANFISEVFNENAKEIFEIVDPIFEESLEAYYGELFEKFLASVPAEEILPE